MNPTPTPFTLPPSTLYTLHTTSLSGRAIFATSPIPPSTILLNTSHHPPCSPLAHLIQRPYRKEVCAHCFAYDRGREWKVKHASRECGVVFCSQVCLDRWVQWNGEMGVEAWVGLEGGVREVLRRRGEMSRDGEGRDTEMLDGDGSGNEEGVTEDQVSRNWESVQIIADVVLGARRKSKQSKGERKVVRNVLERGGDPDLMYYLLTAVVSAYNADKARARARQSGREVSAVPTSTLTNGTIQTNNSSPSSTPTIAANTDTTTQPDIGIDIDIPTLLFPLFTLTPTHTAYHAAHTSLHLYTTSHLYLQTLLPLPLTHYLTPTLSHNLNTRAAHNAFSIRPPGTTDGTDSGEFLGWGVWPAASFFNHSCEPNVGKVRVGRDWVFQTVRDVVEGEELCITYLGGEEAYLGIRERRARLKEEWGFECACEKCRREAGDG